jgi:hypothetical protein
MCDKLSDFQEGQWWVKELDELVKNGTSDQKRAVAVVHNLLSIIQSVPLEGDGIDESKFLEDFSNNLKRGHMV